MRLDRYYKLLFFLPSLVILGFVLVDSVKTGGHSQQFVTLANAFLHGHLNLPGKPADLAADWVYYHGRYYWPLGPLPAIILVPFVFGSHLVNIFFSQAYLQCVFVLGLFYQIVLLGKRLRYSAHDSMFWAFGFILGSAYIGAAVVSYTWLFSAVVVVALLFLALYEYFGKRRLWLLGMLCAALLMTRVDASFIIIFFGLEILSSRLDLSRKIKQLLFLFSPYLVALLLLGLYNFTRFGNFFEQGYSLQTLPPILDVSRAQGIFSLRHVPTNLYYGYLNGPTPIVSTMTNSLVRPYLSSNQWGMSIFWTSPYLLYLFTLRKSEIRGWIVRLLIPVVFIVVFLLTWFASGAVQFGYRFSLDFMPMLLVIIMVVYRKRNKRLSAGMKALLLASGFLNFYLLLVFIGQIK